MAIIKNIDVLGEEIFWIDEVVPTGLVQSWWSDVINYGKWDKGFLAYLSLIHISEPTRPY